MSTSDKERLREGEEISFRGKTERRRIDQQANRLVREGLDPDDALRAAAKSARRILEEREAY